VIRPTVPVNDALKTMCKNLIAAVTVDFDRFSITSESDARFNEMIERKRAEVAGTATPKGAPSTSSTANAADDLMAKKAAAAERPPWEKRSRRSQVTLSEMRTPTK
jgi:non-homologous end joining protein Ku